jgi:tyrosyl-tRNA synthetase
MRGGANPKDFKMRLAREVVTLYYSAQEATAAEMQFNQVFRDKGRPSDMPQAAVPATTEALTVLVALGLAKNKSAAKRLFEQGGVHVNGVTVRDWQAPFTLKPGDVIQVGKRAFVKIS